MMPTNLSHDANQPFIDGYSSQCSYLAVVLLYYYTFGDVSLLCRDMMFYDDVVPQSTAAATALATAAANRLQAINWHKPESLGSTKQKTSSTIMMQLLQQCFIVVPKHQSH